MKNTDNNYNETIVSFFDQELRWWTEVYREDLPRGFFSFEMRRRLQLASALLTTQIQKFDNPAVLECGCGPGDILELLAPLRCKLTGLDLNRRYLDLAAERVPGATLIDGNVEGLPFPDASFDIVYAVGVFQYLDDDHAAAGEICRVTKDGGFVLISFANYRMLHLFLDPYYLCRIFKNIPGRKKQPSNTGFDVSRIRRYSLPQFRNLFREYDMHEIESITTSYGPVKFWRREFLPLATSIRMSEILRHWSGLKMCRGLKRVGNHFIITMRKGTDSGNTPKRHEDLHEQALAAN